MKKSFREVKSLLIMRNLIFFLFKLGFSIFSILFIALITLIIILSTKPRIILPVNNFILSKLNQFENVSINFNTSSATFQFDYSFNLRYRIKEITIKYQDSALNIKNFTINIDILKLLLKQIEIKNIVMPDGDLELDLAMFERKKPIPDEEKQKLLDKYQTLVNKIRNKVLIINRFVLKDLNIIIKNGENKTKLNIISYSFNIDFSKNRLETKQYMLYNINDSKFNSRLKVMCSEENNDKNCQLNVSNINPHSYVNFVNRENPIFVYLQNIKGHFDAELGIILDKKLNIKNGTFVVKSLIGTFDLKQFFDEAIAFNTFEVKGDFDVNLKRFNLSSLTTNFDKVGFAMSMLIEDKPEYKNIDLIFNARNVPLVRLKQLWPNFLGEEGVRPWVLEHIIGGTSPEAMAKINLKYFNNKNKKENSGLQNVYSEVKIDKVILNYDNYFPIITEIDGLATFTEKDMNIDIYSGKLLSSKINSGNVYIDFTKAKDEVIIKANTKGPFSDLFVHIDKNDKKYIEDAVNSIIEDYYTNSNVKIVVPLIDNLTFKSVAIDVYADMLNKKNTFIINSSPIGLSFIKPLNSNNFRGNINLTKNTLKFVPLNIYKEENKKLIFEYECNLNNNIVSIVKFEPKVGYISFSADGFFNTATKRQEFNFRNINYNNSNYNIYFKSHILNGILYNDININGRNINYDNIVEILENMDLSSNSSNNTKNEFKVSMSLDYLLFNKNSRLFRPTLCANLKNSKLVDLSFNASMVDDKNVRISLEKNNTFKIYSNDFGELLRVVDLADIIRGGEGDVIVSMVNIKNKNYIKLDMEITKKFKILTNEDVNKEVLSDIEKEKKFKNLKKNITKESGVDLNKLKGEILYRDNIMNFDKMAASSKFVNLDIIASGFINLKTEEIKINGLLIPLGFINTLFGASKLPIIGGIVFGKQDAGLFASKFTITKKNKNSKLDVDIDKFSMILPGFLRNVLDLNYFNFLK